MSKFNREDPVPQTVGEFRELLLQILATPDASRALHVRSDIDLSNLSLHHTLTLDRADDSAGLGGTF